MKKLYFLCLTILISAASFGQHPVINEVDADTPGTDVAEFIELKWTPSTSLNGYVVVLMNGSDDASYEAYDLDGFSTDSNGFFILANTAVADKDLDIGASNIIQNGADAVTIYLGDDTDFPTDTPATTTNLVDALVYDTSDGDDAGLLTGLGETIQYNENDNGTKDTDSNQRDTDGTYFAAPSTLRAENSSEITYTQVANLAALRAGIVGDYYEVTGEIVAVWAQAYRNQKWAQDGSAGIIIDDSGAKITTIYNEGDGITGIKGVLGSYNGLLQLVPTEDPGVATSTGNPVVAQPVTIATLLADHEPYESELVELTDVTFAIGDGIETFANFINYDISDVSGGPIAFSTYLMRDADYIGEIIPTTPKTIKVIVGDNNGVQVASRNMTTDLILGVKENNIEGFGVYPNPVSNGKFRITTASNAVKQVKIYNMLGKQVYNKTVKANETVEVSNLTTGIYFVNVEEEGKTATKKLVIR